MTKREAFHRFRSVRKELDAAPFALSRTMTQVAACLSALQEAGKGGITLGEFALCHRHLEMTYILGLFSEFEAALRDY